MAAISFGGSDTGNGRPLGVGGRIVGTLVCSIFFLVGLAIAGRALRDAVQTLRTRSWPTAACVVTASGVREDDGRSGEGRRLQFWVAYQYDWQGQHYRSEVYSPGYSGSTDYRIAQRLAMQHPVGSRAVCHVNPARPAEAILEPRSLGGLVAVPFSLVFVGIGAVGLWALRRAARGEATGGAGVVQPISMQARKLGLSARGLVVFFGIFFVIGAIICWLTFGRGVRRIQAAQTWPAVECVVVSSRVDHHRSGKGGTTYSANILYAYRIQNHEFTSNQYDFMGGSSSGYDGKAAIVQRYPPGRKAICYVNPQDPTDAVLERGFVPSMWFGLIPLVFVLVGAMGMICGIRSARRAAAGPAPAAVGTAGFAPTATPWSGTTGNGPVQLKPTASPALKLIGAIAIGLFWNGIVSVFVWQAVQSWHRGRTEWGLTIFLIPFVLVGLGLVGLVGYQFLALFNPRVRLTVSAESVTPGGALELDWVVTGRTSVLQRLSINLEGREEATFRRGTSSYTDKRVFATIPVAESTYAQEMISGRARVMVPPGAMHTFKAANNKILWALQVRGDIPRWPDVKEQYEITVRPAPATIVSDGDASPGGTGPAPLASSDAVRLELSRPRAGYRPGEEIAGVATWNLDRAPRTAEARLFWYTRGKGTVDAGVVETVRFDQAGPSDRREFRFHLPEAPHSFSGQLVSLLWAVELVLLPSKQTARLELTVSPTGHELVLPA